MKILILGSGGVGGYIGARLLKYTDSKVAFVARKEHLEAIKSNGLKIIEDDNEWIVYPDIVTSNPSNLGFFDIIFITVKSTQLNSVLDIVSNNISKDTVIIPLLNGVDYDLIIKEKYPKSHVMNGCIYIISNIIEPGVIRRRGRVFKLCWGSDDFDITNYREIDHLFKKAFERVEAGSDIRLKQWRKFLFISPMAMLTSRYGVSMDIVYIKHYQELLEAMRELVKVANALGVELNQDDIDKSLKQASKVVKGAKTSMQLDIQNSKEPELESLVGYVVKQAKRVGIDTPIYEENYKILESMIYKK